MPKRKRIYYAHPYIDYGTEHEELVIKALEMLGYEVVNPGDFQIQKDFQDYAAKHPENKMQFFADLCDTCDAMAFSCFDPALNAENTPKGDKRVGAGVWYEAETFFKRGLDVIHIDGYYPLADQVKKKPDKKRLRIKLGVKNFDDFIKLSIEETRALIKVYKDKN